MQILSHKFLFHIEDIYLLLLIKNKNKEAFMSTSFMKA